MRALVRRLAASEHAFLLASLVVAAILASAIGYAWLRFHSSAAERSAFDNLSLIADSKQREISVWLAERRSDASLLADSPRFGENLAEIIASGKPPATGRLVRFLGSLIRAYAYRSAYLLDTTGRLVFAVGPAPEPGNLPAALARQAMDRAEITFGELRRLHPGEGAPAVLDIAVPLAKATGGPPVGVVVLRIDADSHLFPLIQKWPTHSASAESVLLRRDGDRVQYLSERHYGNDMRIATPVRLDDPGLASAQAVREPGSMITGSDYRGASVIGASRAIESMDWVLLAKQDRSEYLAPAWRSTAYLAGYLFVLFAAGAVFVSMRWRYQGKLHEQQLRLGRLERETLQKNFDYLIKYARDMITLRDEDGRLVECNEAFLAALGYSREELLGSDYAAVRAPEIGNPMVNILERIVRPGGATYESLLRRKDGSRFPVEVSARLIEIEGRRQYQAVLRDISERKQAQAAREREAQRYRALMESSVDGIYVRDANGCVVEANSAFCALLGYESHELIGRHPSDWNAEFDREALQQRFDRLLPGSNLRMETTHRRKDGSLYDVEVSTTVVELAGERLHFTALRDITERKAAEHRIEHLLRLYATLYRTNEAVLRAASEEELFADICRIAVEQGGVLGAFIWMADAESKKLRPVAWSESLNELAASPAFNDLVARRSSVNAVAFSEDRTVVDNDRLSSLDGSAAHVAFRVAGIRSVVSQPLRRAGKPVGTLTLNSTMVGAFDGDLVELIEQMAADISFALDRFEEARQRERAEASVRESEERFRGLVEQSIAGTYILQDGKLAYANPRFVEIFGYDPAEDLTGRDASSFVVENERASMAETMHTWFRAETASIGYEFSGLRKNGSTVLVGVHGARATHRGRPAIIGLVQDISEKKRAEEQIENYVAQLESAFRSTVEVAMSLSELRDPYTAGHARRVAEIAVAIGAELGYDARRQEGLRVAGYLHDIGKMTIPAEILSKPGKLSPLEYQLIQGHAQSSYDVLKNVTFPWPIAEVVLQHHERMDGGGYPQGLKSEAILREARIMAVADVVEAMSSHRPYRPALGIDKALAEIERGRGTSYDPVVAGACLKLFREGNYAIPA